MGLKYDFWLIEMNIDDIQDRVLTAYGDKVKNSCIVLNAQKKYYDDIDIAFNERGFKAAMDLQKPDILIEYDKRTESLNKGYFSIWGMTLPGTEWSFGNFTNMWGFDAEFTYLFSEMIRNGGIHEFLKVNYHHNENLGHTNRFFFDDDKKILIEEYPMTQKEEQDMVYESYLNRIRKQNGFPLDILHKYLNESRRLDWEMLLETSFSAITGKDMIEG